MDLRRRNMMIPYNVEMMLPELFKIICLSVGAEIRLMRGQQKNDKNAWNSQSD